jgi:hypothetical protein
MFKIWSKGAALFNLRKTEGFILISKIPEGALLSLKTLQSPGTIEPRPGLAQHWW